MPDILFIAFGEACAWASVLELKMRMLADKTPSLKHLAHSQQLQNIELAIAKEFPGHLDANDATLLEKSRVLRNKVVHGNFSRAKEVLLELGVHVPDGGVAEVMLPSNDGQAIMDAIMNGKRSAVSATSTEDSTIFGWLLECGGAGIFPKSVDVFRRAIGVIERLVRLPAPP